MRVVFGDVALRIGCRREVGRRAEELEDKAAARADALRVGVDDHSVRGLTRAGGDERARALELDDADAADVDRRQRLAVAERWRLDPGGASGVEDGRALSDLGRDTVDRDLHRSASP